MQNSVNSYVSMGFLQNFTAKTARLHILFDFKQGVDSAAHRGINKPLYSLNHGLFYPVHQDTYCFPHI